MGAEMSKDEKWAFDLPYAI